MPGSMPVWWRWRSNGDKKDPFFDRDLENYKRLQSDGAVSLGILITRGITLQDQMRSMVLRFAVEKAINDKADLQRIGLNPTQRQLAEYARRQRGETTFAQAWAAAFVQINSEPPPRIGASLRIECGGVSETPALCS